jgi:hypothetical protein
MMSPAPQNAPLTADQRRALAFLARSTDGCPEALMLAHGFPSPLLAHLIGVGFVAAESREMHAGKRVLTVRRLRITEAGRRAIAGGAL